MKLKKQIVIPVVVGLVAFVAGFFIGDASAISRVKKEIGSAISTNVKVDKEEAKKDEQAKQEPKKEEIKVLKVGEKYNYKDKYEITINKVILTDKRNQFTEKKANKVAVIEFTYKNLTLDEDLFISESNFKTYDEVGNVLESYPAGAEKMPQNIAQGKQCTAEMSYGFNEGSKLELDYYDNMFNDKADVKFMVEMQ
ncbi:hypothetical protein [Clostridium tunisiense]|uniref:hypothetical protein n=1 Tax=Clostridium tunisiense TaxID=219748 RepID=UPI0003128366|nr:hypothetical protein [Clostridium tunisiense]